MILKKFVFLTLIAVIQVTECGRYSSGGSRRTGGSTRRTGGWSTTGSGGSHTSHSSSGGESHTSHSSSGGSQTSHSTNGNQHSGSNYGWTAPKSQPTQTHQQPSSSNNGWKTSDSQSHQQAPQPSSSNYGWTAPKTPQTQTHQQTPQTQNHPAGWEAPKNPQTHPQTPQTQNHQTVPTKTQDGHQQQGSNSGQPYGWSNPQTHNQPPPYSPTQNRQPPPPYSAGNHQAPPPYTPTGNRNPYPHQPPPAYSPNPQHHYYTGYQSGYAHGYHSASQQRLSQPSQYGFGQTYYPSQNHFGYPGQGLYSANYGGMSLFGSPGHYGYSNAGAWGVPSYGSGQNHDMLKGMVVGAVGGYLLNSFVHRSTNNPWQYHGSGYGSNYNYVTINHHHAAAPVNATRPDATGPGHWLQCVAFDPTTQTTLINPNCSCTVEVTKDPATNLSTSTHYCNSTYGAVTEKTPVGRYGPDIEVWDPKKAPPQDTNPEKYLKSKPLTEDERQKVEFFQRLEKVVNMGSFTQ